MAKKTKKPAKKAVKKAKKPVRKAKSMKKKTASVNPQVMGMLGWYGVETQASQRMIKAIPDEKLTQRIHQKFRSAGELATHLGDAMRDLMSTLNSGTVAFSKPSNFATTNEILAHYQKASGEFMTAAKTISEGKLKKKYAFEMNGKVMWEPTGYELISTWICHEIHHRAHIGAILRVLDAKVPGMYGPTGDEM